MTKKAKKNNTIVNFLLTTVATLIGVIMAINLSVNNEATKEKQDLIKVLETGISVIDRVCTYISKESKTNGLDKKTDSLRGKVLDTLKMKKNDLQIDNVSMVSNGISNTKQINNEIESKKKTLDSLKKILDITDVDVNKKLSTSLVISYGGLSVPFPDFITTILTDSGVLKNLSKPTLDRLSQDHINLTRSYEIYSKNGGDSYIYMLTLEEIQRTLYFEIEYQKNNIDITELIANYETLDEYISSKLVYLSLKKSL